MTAPRSLGELADAMGERARGAVRDGANAWHAAESMVRAFAASTPSLDVGRELMANELDDIADRLEGHYDGAPDSGMKWLGNAMSRIRHEAATLRASSPPPPPSVETTGGFDKRCADALADEVAVLVRRGVIDARSPAADALLDYRNPPSLPRADRMAELEAEVAALSSPAPAPAETPRRTWFTGRAEAVGRAAYIMGYQAGHHDTVESCFGDAASCWDDDAQLRSDVFDNAGVEGERPAETTGLREAVWDYIAREVEELQAAACEGARELQHLWPESEGSMACPCRKCHARHRLLDASAALRAALPAPPPDSGRPWVHVGARLPDVKPISHLEEASDRVLVTDGGERYAVAERYKDVDHHADPVWYSEDDADDADELGWRPTHWMPIPDVDATPPPAPAPPPEKCAGPFVDARECPQHRRDTLAPAPPEEGRDEAIRACVAVLTDTVRACAETHIDCVPDECVPPRDALALARAARLPGTEAAT